MQPSLTDQFQTVLSVLTPGPREPGDPPPDILEKSAQILPFCVQVQTLLGSLTPDEMTAVKIAGMWSVVTVLEKARQRQAGLTVVK